MSTVITFDELLVELDRIDQECATDGETMSEIRQRLGISEKKASALMKKAIADGRVIVGRRTVRNIAGLLCQVPCYRVVATTKGKRK